MSKNTNLNAHGNTRLVRAVDACDLAAVNALIAEGLDVNQIVPPGTSALVAAVTKECVPVISALIDAGADVNIKGGRYIHYPLKVAVDLNNTKVAELLLNAGANVNLSYDDGNLLFTAIIHKNLDLVNLLITKGADVNYVNNRAQTPLDIAIRVTGKDAETPIIDALLNANANVNYITRRYGSPNFAIIQMAAKYGSPAVIAKLIARGADVNTVVEGKTALIVALESFVPNSIPNALFLLDNGAGATVNSASTKDVYGKTALHLAAEHDGSAELIRRLAAAGGDLNAKDGFGYSPLLRAYQNSILESFRTLLELGADIERGAQNPAFPLLYSASLHGKAEFVKLLLAYGANTEFPVSNEFVRRNALHFKDYEVLAPNNLTELSLRQHAELRHFSKAVNDAYMRIPRRAVGEMVVGYRSEAFPHGLPSFGLAEKIGKFLGGRRRKTVRRGRRRRGITRK